MASLLDMMNAPDPVQLRKAQTYAQFAPSISPYGSADVRATDEAIRQAQAQAQANTLQETMRLGGPAGMADRLGYQAEAGAEQALAKRMMDEYKAKQGLYGSYLNQLSREDQARNAVADAQTQAANQYAGMMGETAGQLGGIGMGVGQWWKGSQKPQSPKVMGPFNQATPDASYNKMAMGWNTPRA